MSYIGVANPVLAVLPNAGGGGQGVVGSIWGCQGCWGLAGWVPILGLLGLVYGAWLVQWGPHWVGSGLGGWGLMLGWAVDVGVVVVLPIGGPVACVSGGGVVGVRERSASLSV